MTTPRPEEPDVHLRVLLGGLSLDFAACHTAAVRFIKEWRSVRAAADLIVVPGGTAGLPRLPCERLYLQP
ncbi:hypothetical protein [Nocardia implantans]|uniref:Glutaminase n=1 Tax=Nocardia implantans TaxID=3108168 RepID=A0ABU6AW72_9NOCA|nr:MULTISPECIES: hypothetical protein [unclassified Nocardia]MBF6192889.1 hypothetical protein [Nocardia beijingensis]MEA3531393.1 hypothetical protein [Nocardia sp. CDC192]MEB3511740.1 hypothetical protein [Nocardia sp. CDC186]